MVHMQYIPGTLVVSLSNMLSNSSDCNEDVIRAHFKLFLMFALFYHRSKRPTPVPMGTPRIDSPMPMIAHQKVCYFMVLKSEYKIFPLLMHSHTSNQTEVIFHYTFSQRIMETIGFRVNVI